MKKRVVILGLLLALGAALYVTYNDEQPAQTLYVSRYFSCAQDAQKAFINQKPVMLWDLHGVLFYKPRFSMITRGLWNIENKPKFIFQFFSALCRSNIRKTIHHFGKQECLVSQAYFDAAQEYDHAYTQLIKLTNNIYIPNKPIYNVVEALTDEGCKHYLFSNIGPKALKDLQKTYPQYFAFLEEQKNTINPSTPHYTHWVWKPQTQAFNKALDYLNKTHKPWTTIFVDDNIKNIKKAQEMGMNAILFASVEQFENDINQLVVINGDSHE